MRIINITSSGAVALTVAAAATLAAGISKVSASPTVAAGYSLTAFASPLTVTGLNQGIIPGASQITSAPDDIAVSGSSVFIGWGDNVASDGSDGGQSVVAQYTLTGQLVNHFNVTGHVEGMAMGGNGMLYTDENEDGNSALTVINTATGSQMRYGYPNPSVHGGGFDGLQFVNGNLYASGSNPDNGGDGPGQVNSHPVIYQVNADPNSYPATATAVGVLWGNDSATNAVTGQTTQLNVFDPDSLNLTPNGSLLLSNESGAQLTEVTNPGPNQTVTSLNLTDANGNPVNTDDTGFATSSKGTLLFSDVKNNVVYALTANNGFAMNQAFSSDKTNHSLDMLNFSTGVMTPIVTGLGGPAGIGFINDPSAVPEPATLAMILLGGACVFLTPRKRMSK
jgi:hypothetical protein